MRRRELMLFLGGALVTARGGRAADAPVIGYLSTGSAESDDFRLTALRRGLNETGYIEGKNVTIEYRWAQGHNDRLPTLASDLVRRQVTVIATVSPPAAFAAKAATTAIPIVFVVGIDPVQSGLVASLSRPGGNITGVALISEELVGKRLELLHELVPTAPRVGLLVDPTNPVSEPVTRAAQGAAHSLGLQLHVVRASTAGEIDAAFEALAGFRAGGLVFGGGPFFTNQRAQIVALAARYLVPAISNVRLFPEVGGLMSYGSDLANSFRQAGIYTSKILKGAQPADLPVEQAVKIELVINLKAANALGLPIPQSILARADEVIE